MSNGGRGGCGRSHPRSVPPLGSFLHPSNWLFSPGPDPSPTIQTAFSHQSPSLAILGSSGLDHPFQGPCWWAGVANWVMGPSCRWPLPHPDSYSHRTSERPVRVLREFSSLKMTPNYAQGPPLSSADLRRPLSRESWNLALQ